MLTLELQVAVLPPGSVAVNVTLTVPTSEQVKLLWERESEREQLSVEPLSTSPLVMVASPLLSR